MGKGLGVWSREDSAGHTLIFVLEFGLDSHMWVRVSWYEVESTPLDILLLLVWRPVCTVHPFFLVNHLISLLWPDSCHYCSSGEFGRTPSESYVSMCPSVSARVSGVTSAWPTLFKAVSYIGYIGYISPMVAYIGYIKAVSYIGYISPTVALQIPRT